MAQGQSSDDGKVSKAAHVFVTTRWSLVLAAGQEDDEKSADALEQLCRAYWFPLYARIRREGHSPEDAQDLTQEFFSRLLARKDIAVATPERGRFRSYLLGALKHFLADAWDKSRALKRGGGATLFSLDAEDPESRFVQETAGSEAPDREFERRWATAVLDHGLGRLRNEFAAAGKLELFEALKGFLSTPPGPGDYDAVATKLGMSPGAVTVSVHRMRQRYGELVRAEIAETVDTPEQVEHELRELFAALG